jgi:long-chain acyl-CoA synthetase
MTNQDTSGYWRKRLALDSPLPPDMLKKYRSAHRLLRPFVYSVLDVIFRFYCKEKVYGLENLPDSPYIIAVNHASAMDYVTVAWAMGKKREELYPIATKLFYDFGFTRFWMKAASNVVRIDTVEDFFPALRVAAQILRAGKAVYIHPEGMRSTNGKILPFRPGVGVLAVETEVPLVPVYVSGTGQALPPGSIFLHPNPVSVSFGEPIEMAPYIEKKKTMQAYDVYKEVTEELRKRVVSLAEERQAR